MIAGGREGHEEGIGHAERAEREGVLDNCHTGCLSRHLSDGHASHAEAPLGDVSEHAPTGASPFAAKKYLQKMEWQPVPHPREEGAFFRRTGFSAFAPAL